MRLKKIQIPALCGRCLFFVKTLLLDDNSNTYDDYHRHDGDYICDHICKTKQEMFTKRAFKIWIFIIIVRISLTLTFVRVNFIVFSAGCLNIDCNSLFFSRVGSHTSVRGAEILLVYSERQRESGAVLDHYLLVFVPQQCQQISSFLHRTQQGAAVSAHNDCRSWDRLWRGKWWRWNTSTFCS